MSHLASLVSSGKSDRSFRPSRLTEEGRFAVVTNVEVGCGGRGVAQRAFGRADERHGADGQVAWS